MIRTILTCSPHFTDSALNEIRRQHPDVSIFEHIAPGYTVLQSLTSFDELTRPWRQRLPIYLHHLFPIQAVVPLEISDLEPLKRAARKIAPLDATIQVRSTVETGLSALDVQQFLTGKQAVPSVHAPSGRIVSILVAQDETGLRAYLGTSWAAQNLSPWPGGQIPITEPVANRAGYKLLEALTVFSIRLRRGDQALDLGAAPGAWTTLLRRRCLRVTAVAPAPLYPWLTFDRDVVYQPLRAEEFLRHCRETYDLVVNDMKLDAQDSARVMVDYARHLRSEGIGIMTLKLRERNRQRVMDHSFRILRKAYKIIQVRQLVSNGEEVTLFLRRKR